MKQAALAGPRTFEIQDAERPQPGPGEVLVRVRSVGVCGSDLHFYRGEFPCRRASSWATSGRRSRSARRRRHGLRDPATAWRSSCSTSA